MGKIDNIFSIFIVFLCILSTFLHPISTDSSIDGMYRILYNKAIKSRGIELDKEVEGTYPYRSTLKRRKRRSDQRNLREFKKEVRSDGKVISKQDSIEREVI